jgi:3-deoxy-D-manno-octulosonic-acid transferase
MYLIYNLLSWPTALLLSPWLAYRTLRGRLPGLSQRLGMIPPQMAESPKPTIWLHAVSLGEVKAAGPLVAQLRVRCPQLRVVMTTSTRTGFQAAQQMLRPEETVLFPPFDLSWICRRFLHRIRPQAVLVMETELWPNLFREAKRFGVPLLLVNGRVSDRAFPRYHATRSFWRRVLAQPDVVLAQNKTDAERFLALGADPARVTVAGNLKYAIRPSTVPVVSRLRRMAEQAAAGPILVAGSTMPGEEKYLLAAFQELRREFPRLWMILAPRHPARFDSVVEEVRAAGVPLLPRSQLDSQTMPQLPGVLLLDTTGELASVYELATVAFVGGTLVPTGGHNILEPACFARPIVIGPSMTNFQEIADAFLHANPSPDLIRAATVSERPTPIRDREGAESHSIPGVQRTRIGAVAQIPDADALAPALRFLFKNLDFSERMGKSARWLLENTLNPTDRILAELERRMPSQTARSADAVGFAGKAVSKAGTWQQVQR